MDTSPNNQNQILRASQTEALKALADHQHVLLIAPTGSGKTLVFELHARQFDRVIAVVPLVALARQLAQNLANKGFETIEGFGGSARSPAKGEKGIWIVSPEVLSNRLEVTRRWLPEFLFVDEAHCVWDWADDFRPEFLSVFDVCQLSSLRSSYWATATIPSLGVRFLREGLENLPLHIVGQFSVPSSIQIRVMHESLHKRLGRVREVLSTDAKDACVIFVSTRQLAERVYSALQAEYSSTAYYHAGLSPEERKAIESNFRSRKTRFMIATSAFGMGMDISHLRHGIILQPTVSLLALAQAIGRVGRTGDSAKVYAFWDSDDFGRLSWIAEGSERRGRMLAEAEAWYRSRACKIHILEKYFDSKSPDSQGNCGRCSGCANISH